MDMERKCAHTVYETPQRLQPELMNLRHFSCDVACCPAQVLQLIYHMIYIISHYVYLLPVLPVVHVLLTICVCLLTTNM